MNALKDMLKPEDAAKLASLKAEPICTCEPHTGSFHQLGETDLIVHSCGLPKRGAYERAAKWYDDAFAKGVRLAENLRTHGVAVVADLQAEQPAKPRKLTKADAIEVDPRSEAMIEAACVDCGDALLIEPKVPAAYEGEARVPICVPCAKVRLAEAVTDQRHIEVAKRATVAIDRDTGARLSEEQAEQAAANPGIYTWVEWNQTPVQEENSMTEIDLSNLSDAELGAYVRSTMQAKAEAEIKPKAAKAKAAKKAADEADKVLIKAEQKARKGRVLVGFAVSTTLEVPALDTTEVSSLDECPSAKERSPYNKARFRLEGTSPLDPETTTYRVLMDEHVRLRDAAAAKNKEHAEAEAAKTAKPKKAKKAKKAKATEVNVSGVAVLADLTPEQQAKVTALVEITGMFEAKAREIVLGV